MAKMSTHNDWDPLEEVIVGSATNYTSHDRELSFDVFFHENLFRSDWAYPRLKQATKIEPDTRSWSIKERYVQELAEDVHSWPGMASAAHSCFERP